ncbi:GPP34 family phosphoprotein [Streptomonospora sp. S1-112]|uniref:GPP34 family phosphoprotein n=1 Tax=Streptomonospora mangrovi TaxID=2883123 RepID=A0A9X3NW13_9ACTN|nr:GPP34 family phosphoprotein [Streptomonospora mangrovi]MDA0565296.1 GPP34 family phosphoprotein [Streptomonospora mangrovi]
MTPHGSTGGSRPRSLPERLYLLSYDLDKKRLDAPSSLYRHQLLRGAALVELSLRGLVVDRGGKAARGDGPEPDDALLAGVLADVPAHRPRHWAGLLVREPGAAERTVRERLAEAGVVTVETRRLLGVLPLRTVTPVDGAEVRLLRERVRDIVIGGDPAAAPAEDVALAVLALEGNMAHVLTWRERRDHKRAIAALNAHFDAMVPGVRSAVRLAVANATSGG